MTFEHMEHFLTLCQYLNYSQAAQEVFISQSTLSRQVQSLERELSCTLFLRGGNQLVLTEAGKLLRAYAISALEEHAQFLSTLRRLSSAENGCLHIGYITEGQKSILSDGQRKYPELFVESRYVRAYPSELLPLLENGSLQGALLHSVTVPSSSDLWVRTLCRCWLTVLVPEGSPLEAYTLLRSNDLSILRKMTYVSFERQIAPQLYDYFHDFLRMHHAEPAQTIPMNEFDSVLLNLHAPTYFSLGSSLEPTPQGYKRIRIAEDAPWYNLAFVCQKGAKPAVNEIFYALLSTVAANNDAENA